MFDGKIKPVKPVSGAGGQKRDASTKSLIDNARKLREQRENDRKKQNACILIQKIIRGHLYRKTLSVQLTHEFSQKMIGVEKIKNLFATRKQTFNVPIEIIRSLLKSYILPKVRVISNHIDHFASLCQVINDSLEHSSTQFNLLTDILDEKYRDSTLYYLTSLLRSMLVLAGTNNRLEDSLVNNCNQIFQNVFIAYKCSAVTNTKEIFDHFTTATFDRITSNVCDMVSMHSNEAIPRSNIVPWAKTLVYILVSKLKSTVQSGKAFYILNTITDVASLSASTQTSETKLWIEVVSTLVTSPNFTTSDSLQPLASFLCEAYHSIKGFGWILSLNISSSVLNSIAIASKNNFLQSSSLHKKSPSHVLLLCNFLRSIFLDRRQNSLQFSDVSISALLSNDLQSLPFSAVDVPSKASSRSSIIFMKDLTENFARETSANKPQQFSISFTAASMLFGYDVLHEIHESLQCEPFLSLLRLMDDSDGFERAYTNTSRNESDFIGPGNKNFESDKTMKIEHSENNRGIITHDDSAVESYSGTKRLEHEIKQRQSKLERLEASKFGSWSLFLNSFADYLLIITNARLLSTALSRPQDSSPSSSIGESLRNQSEDFTQIAENYGSDVKVDDTPSMKRPNTKEDTESLKSPPDSKFDAVIRVTNIYSQILTLTPTSSDVLAEKSRKSVLNVNSSQSANSVEANSSSTTPRLLLNSYRNMSIANNLLNSLAFSYPESPISLRLWLYLKRNTNNPETIIEAVISHDEHVMDQIVHYNLLLNNGALITSYSNPYSRMYSQNIKIASKAMNQTKEQFCCNVTSLLFLLASILTHQLLGTDDEEFFEFQRVLPIDDIKTLVGILKSTLHRFFSNPINCEITKNRTNARTQSATTITTHASSSISSSSSSTLASSTSQPIKSNSAEQFFIVQSTPSLEIKDSKNESNEINLIRKYELVILRRQHQQYSFTRLFNALFSRNERRPYLPLQHWQWSGMNSMSGDFKKRIDEIIGRQISGQHDESDPIDMSSLLANDNMKQVLTCIPQVIPFEQRIMLFHSLLLIDSRLQQTTATTRDSVLVSVRRNFVVEDSYNSLAKLPERRLKGRIKVEFISEQGLTEAGIDGGGLFKAFLDLFMKSAFDPSAGLFLANSDQLLAPNPASSVAVEDHLSLFNFYGKMLGIAVYNKILVEPQFSGAFLNVLVGKLNHIDDLWHVDKTLHHSLMSLKHMAISSSSKTSSKSDDDNDPIAALGLYFEIDKIIYDANTTDELIPNGSSILVTKKNLLSYIHRYAHYKLNLESSPQTRAFLAGFRIMIPQEWLKMFSCQEMQLIISGEQKSIDIEDMRRHVNYGGGYSDSHPYIQEFWRIVSEMSPHHQGCLLRFVTSCSRQPLLGFKQLNPKFGILQVPCYDLNNIVNSDVPLAPKLPSAATCMNLLKLPLYDSTQLLEEKLLYAITSDSGFELS